MSFDESPLLAIWETTQACDLACVHCPPSAAPQRQFSELSTEEGYRLLEAVRQFGNPLMVLSGGNPLMRPDIFALLRRSVELGLRTHISPSISPLLNRASIWEFRKCGVARMAIGLDGPDAASHDGLSGASGTFQQGVAALEDARRIGLETQIQTAVTRRNMRWLDKIAGLAARVGARQWSVYFPTMPGHAAAGSDLTSDEFEEIFESLCRISREYGFEVQTCEATHYRRYLARRLQQGAFDGEDHRGILWRTGGVNDGRGLVFISPGGEIYPSASLPISAGNVRFDSLVQVYRTSPLFLELRDCDARQGKCGYCEYRRLCGGSRARAYAVTGDYLAEDPRCNYQPLAKAAAAGSDTCKIN